jgi:hypothetical protein
VRVVICIFFFSIPLMWAEGGTVRSRAQTRFSFLDWFLPPDAAIYVVPPALALAGGNESFPAITAPKNEILPAIYPSVGTIGVLDYSGIHPALLLFARTFGESISVSRIPETACSPERRFLSAVLDERLGRFSDISDVYFGRPVLLENDRAELRYRFLSGDSNTTEELLTILAVKTGAGWLVEDFWFGGL